MATELPATLGTGTADEAVVEGWGKLEGNDLLVTIDRVKSAFGGLVVFLMGQYIYRYNVW